MDKTFPYPGIKHHLIKYMPARIEGHFYDLFLGSGLVSYAIDVSKKHVGVDIDKNVIAMHNALKSCSWADCEKLQTFITRRWNLAEKDEYYEYRTWFNTTLFSSGHKKTGLGLMLLARSCLNGMLRFGPNGFNQSSGLRFQPFTQDSYTRLHNKAQTMSFVCDDFRNVAIPKESHVYADPPYLTNPIETYGLTWKPETLRQALRICANHTFWYTDTENKVNTSFKRHYNHQTKTLVLKAMRSQSPGGKKTQVLTGRNELLITNWFNKLWQPKQLRI